MSAVRIHPFYVVHDPLDTGCGHQHSTKQRATNCASAMLHNHPTMPHAQLIKISGFNEKASLLLQHVEEKITNVPLSERVK